MALTITPSTPKATDILGTVSSNVFASISSVASLESVQTFSAKTTYETPAHFVASQVTSSQHATTASLPPMGQQMISESSSDAGSISSGSLFDELVSDTPEPTMDLSRWGIDAVRNFGYRLDQVLGDFVAAGDPDARRYLWRASRITDGREVFMICTAASGELGRKTRHRLREEFRALHALRREAVVSAEALLMTRFDAWLVLHCKAGATARAYDDECQPSALPAAILMFVQLLQGLAHLNKHTAAASDVTLASQLLDAAAKTVNTAAAPPKRKASADFEEGALGAAETLEASGASDTTVVRRRGERAGEWAAALGSYADIWSGLPLEAQEEAISLVMRSDVLCGVIARDRAPAALLNLFKHYLAVDVRVRPSAAEILRRGTATHE